jgi:hypothetical protein
MSDEGVYGIWLGTTTTAQVGFQPEDTAERKQLGLEC